MHLNFGTIRRLVLFDLKLYRVLFLKVSMPVRYDYATYIRAHIRTNARTLVGAHAHTQSRLYVRTYAYARTVCMHVCTHAYTHMRECTNAYGRLHGPVVHNHNNNNNINNKI